MARNPIFDAGPELAPLPDPTQQPSSDEIAAMIEQAHQQAQAAAQQAQLEQNAYQTALAQPTPQVNPIASGFGMGLARLGQAIAGPHAPNYAGEERALIESNKKQLETDRQANLLRLRQTYEAAAKRAADAGDHEAEIKSRAAIHKLDVQMKKDEAAATEENRKATIALGNRNADENARHNKVMEGIGQQNADNKKKEGIADINDVITNNTRTVTFMDGSSKDYIDATNLKGKDLTAAQNQAAKSGIPLLVGKQVDTISEVENARDTVHKYMQALEPVVGRSALDPRRATAPLKAFLGVGDEATVQAYNEAMIQIIPALITRGIRITQGEIKQLQHNTPSLGLPLAVNQKRTKIYEEILDRVARRQVSIGKSRNSAETVSGTVTLVKDGVSKTLSREEFDKRGGETAAKEHGYTVQQ